MDKISFFYANSSAVGVSPWDVTFIFERVGLAAGLSLTAAHQAAPQGQSVQATSQLDRCDVVLPAGQAKLFAASALASILEMEKQSGDYPLPPDEMTKYNKFIASIRGLIK